MQAWLDLPLDQRNLYFLGAPAYWEDVIQDMILETADPWRLVHNRTSSPLGMGLVRDAFRFHADKPEMRGLQRWRNIQVSRKPSGADQGLDACEDNPTLLNYDWEKVSNRGQQSECMTPYICIDDIMNSWEFGQQLDLINNFLGRYHIEKDSNYSCETHLRFANDAGRIFVLGNGYFSDNVGTYNPTVVDADGDNILTVAQGAIAPLSFRALSPLNAHFEYQAPGGQISAPVDGRRIFGGMLHLEDFERMIEQDSQLRQDYRDGNASVNIEGYGSVKMFRGWGFMHNALIPRWTFKSTNGTTMTLKRVDPYILTTTGTLVANSNGTQGSGQGRWISNPDYLKAEYGTFIPLIKDVLELQIPVARPAAPGGGTSFDPGNGFEGSFQWYNRPDMKVNFKGNKGFYYYEAKRLPYPLRYDRQATAVIYRRFPASSVTTQELVGTAPTIADGATDVSTVAVSGSTTLVAMTFAGILPITTVPKAVSLTGGITAYVVGTGGRPTYIISCTSAANATTLISNSGSNVITIG